MGKMEKIKAKWTQVSLKNVLKVKDPKLSRVLIVQNNVYAAVHGAIGEDRQTCKKKMLTSSYLRTGVRVAEKMVRFVSQSDYRDHQWFQNGCDKFV